MSYLNSLRLHFAGQFQASISTVNNTSSNFDSATFTPANIDPYGVDSDGKKHFGWGPGGFSPKGDAAWRLIGCKVTSAFMPGGLSSSDPILSMLIADSDSEVCAKLVDLDSEQQLVSTIWGLQVRITDGDGNTLLRGDFEPSAFMDIWGRSQGGSSDAGAGAMWQSVLTNLKWADVSSSPFLTALKAAAEDGLLSIKFNVDGYSMDNEDLGFLRGRITGTLGPADADEPHQFVRGRQLAAIYPPTQGFPVPEQNLNWCVARLDETAGKVYLDLGNALPTTGASNALADVGDLTLQTKDGGIILGTVPAKVYSGDNSWYATTAGVVEFPTRGSLTPDQIKTLRNTPLCIVGKDPSHHVSAVNEADDGRFVRADHFVHRLNPLPSEPDNSVSVPIFATRFGAPLTGIPVGAYVFNAQLQQQGDEFPVGTPAGGISFPTSTAPTDANGGTALTITGRDPGNPRGPIDGQVYGIALNLPGQPQVPASQWHFISLLVWDKFTPDNPITWWGSIQPIMRQYANLYPVMSRFMDLGDYRQVSRQHPCRLLQLAFGLDVADPNSMPVTRDLSWSKRQAIIAWLSGGTFDESTQRWNPPLEGAKPTASPDHPGQTATRADRNQTPPTLPQGGKALALSRRLCLRRSQH